MDHRNSGAVGRAETKAAKDMERQQRTAVVWAEVEAKRKAQDAQTARLREARLARDAAAQATPESEKQPQRAGARRRASRAAG